MSSLRSIPAPDQEVFDEGRLDTRLVVKAAALGFCLLTVAGGLLWWRFGASIFFDMLAFAQACF